MAAEKRLTALAVKSLHAPGKHFDGGGLYLHVLPNGRRYWKLKYRFAGRESVLSFGSAEDVSLAEARLGRDAAKALIRQGIHPRTDRLARRAAQEQAESGEFRQVATRWLQGREAEWAPPTLRKARLVLGDYLFPALQGVSIAELTTSQAMRALDGMADIPELAKKARQYLQAIVAFAIQRGLREEGRVLQLRGALSKPRRARHMPAVTDPATLGRLIVDIRGYPAEVTRTALLMALYTALRPMEVVAARWDEINLEAREWRIPAERMKTGHEHIVPITNQMAQLLGAMLAYTAGREYVFPPLARQRSPHLSRDSLSAALRRLGYRNRHSTHGFRSTFRTLARERLDVSEDVLEAQLSHAKPGEVRRAYDHTRFDEKRREVMQRWNDYVDVLAAGAGSPGSAGKVQA